MNPGLSEEAGNTARSVIEALKLRPDFVVLLALIVFITVGSIYARRLDGERHQKIVTELIERCMEPAKR
jgi:hypothetical protein